MKDEQLKNKISDILDTLEQDKLDAVVGCHWVAVDELLFYIQSIRKESVEELEDYLDRIKNITDEKTKVLIGVIETDLGIEKVRHLQDKQNETPEYKSVKMTPWMLENMNRIYGLDVKEAYCYIPIKSDDTPEAKPRDNIELKREEELIETIKDVFTRNGVKQKSEGRIVTYFTPDSATDFVEDLTKTLIHLKDDNKIRRDITNGFIERFCNNHNGKIRWLRGVSLDMDTLLEDILEYLKKEGK